MKNNFFQNIRIIRYAVILLMVFVFGFSDISSFLPDIAQNIGLSDNLKVNRAHALLGDGVFIYDQTTPTTNVQSRTWNEATSSVSAASSPFAGSGVSKHVYTKGNAVRNEMLLGIQDSAGLLTIYMSTDSGASWVSQWTATVGDGNLKRYEIAFEQTSGDALVVYSANVGTTNEIKYQTWNGTVWSGALNLDPIRTSGTIYGIRAAERSGSDEIGIVWVDTNNQMSANLWTGSAWYGEPTAPLVSGTYTTIARSGGAAPSAVPTRRGYDLAFESVSGDLMVVWGNDSLSTTQVDPRYIIKTAGGAWGAAAGTAIANLTEDGEMIDIAASPISDKVALSTCSVDTGSDCNAIIWSGTAWGTVSSDTSSAAAITGESSNNVEWLVDGVNEVAIMTYSDSVGGGIDWRTAANGTTIVAQTDDTAVPAVAGLERAGFSKVNPSDSREAIFIFEDANADIFVKRAYLTGTTVAWSNPTGLTTAIETNTSVTGFNPVGFAFQRFAPAVLTVSASGSQTADLDSGSNNAYLGGAFTFSVTSGTAGISGIKISNAGSAGSLSDIRLLYDTDGTYSGTESCFNTVCADGSGGTLGSNISGSLSMNPGNTYYIYVIADIPGTVAGGLTVDLEITNPSTDVASTAVNTDTAVKNITGLTTVRPNVTSITYPISPDGGRLGDIINISGAGFGNVCNANSKTEIGGYALSCTGASFNNTSISISIDSLFPGSNYGGTGTSGLLVTIGSAADDTYFDFIIYPRITSSPASGQIGSEIAISGDHFGPGGSVTINTKPAAITAPWSETSLTARIPGQEGAANKDNGSIKITRSDTKESNLFDPDGAGLGFRILGPSLSGTTASGMVGQTLPVEFTGLGIDTDDIIANPPVIWLHKAGSLPGSDDIPDSGGYGTDIAYQKVHADFNLTGAIEGSYDLKVRNMDGLEGTCLGCFTINPSGPSITGISPSSGFNFEILSGISITGSNFDASPTVKLTKSGESDITPSTPFTRSSAVLLTGGAFDFTAKAPGAWTVVVTNSDAKSASYSSFTINPAVSNIYQFAGNTDITQPPALNVAEGGGIGNQSVVYFRLDMDSNKASGETIKPEVEIQPIGISFQCILSNCPEQTSGFFVQGSFPYSGTSIRDFVNINGITAANDGNYHWRIRLTNSAGKTGAWTEFGTEPQATNTDLYLDNTPPLLAGVCPATNISDTSATIDWNTIDANPPGEEDFATAQVEYKIGTDAETWTIPGNLSPATPNPRAGGPHVISLSNLSAGSGYVLRARSKDLFGNEGFSTNCTFTTGAAMPIKTVEMFIAQEQGSVVETARSYNFSVTIPENPDNIVSLRSAMIELNGVSGASATDQTINVGFLRNNPPSGPAGDNFTIESSSSGPTPFMILFDALNAQGNGQENMQDLITSGPAGSKNYTLFLKGTTTPTYVLNAKLILTYSYTP